VDKTLKLRLRKPLRAGTWNVRTLLGPGSARMLVAELKKARVSLMGLQEVRWWDIGETLVADHTILWFGPVAGAVRQAGVALVFDRKASAALISWCPVNSRLLIAKLAHSFGGLTVIVAYAPTNKANKPLKIILSIIGAVRAASQSVRSCTLPGRL